MGLDLKAATIQILKGSGKNKFGKHKYVVTEFDEECIGMEEVASPLISNKEYSKRKKTKRVTLYDTSEEASEHVKEYYSHVGGSTKS